MLAGKSRFCSMTLEGTKFAEISAEFTICTASLLAVLWSFERLCAVEFPILYRRKASLRRSLISVGTVLIYTLTLSLPSLAGSRWRRTTVLSHERHNTFCDTDRSQHCACIRSKMAEQKNTVFAGRFGRVSYRL